MRRCWFFLKYSSVANCNYHYRFHVIVRGHFKASHLEGGLVIELVGVYSSWNVGWRSAGAGLGLLAIGHSVLEPVALTGDGDDQCVVQEAVEDGRRSGHVLQELAPVLGRAVRSGGRFMGQTKGCGILPRRRRSGWAGRADIGEPSRADVRGRWHGQEEARQGG